MDSLRVPQTPHPAWLGEGQPRGEKVLSPAEAREVLAESPKEGIYVRHADGARLAARAKLVRPEFTQAIDDHWSRRPMEPNAIAAGLDRVVTKQASDLEP